MVSSVIDTILDPQIWLVLVAVVHAIMGVILPTEWENDTNKLVSGWFLLTSVTMLGTAFFLEGEERAKMAVLIAGPIWVWFVIICAQGLEWSLGKMQTTMNWKENAPPLILWGILALSGLLGSGWV